MRHCVKFSNEIKKRVACQEQTKNSINVAEEINNKEDIDNFREISELPYLCADLLEVNLTTHNDNSERYIDSIASKSVIGDKTALKCQEHILRV